jgi:hypothetical protein
MIKRGIINIIAGLSLCLSAASASAAATPICDATRLVQHMRQENLPILWAEHVAQGGLLAIGNENAEAMILWFGTLPDGRLATSSRVVKHDSLVSGDTVGNMVNALEASVLCKTESDRGGCDCWASASATPDPAVDKWKATQWGASTTEKLERHDDRMLARSVHYLVLLVLLMFMGLMIRLAINAIRTSPHESGMIALVAILAILIRVSTSERLPVGAAHGDMTHLVDIANWMLYGLGFDPGPNYPAAYRLFLFSIFKVTGLSVSLAMWLTTLIGALTVVPIYHVVKKLEASPLAGLFAALSWAVFPVAIYFNNGINLATPAAFLIAMMLYHAVSYGCMESRKHALGLVLASFLFVQTRTELPVIALALVPALVAAFTEKGLLRDTVKSWPIAMAGAIALIPYLILLKLDMSQASYASGLQDLLPRVILWIIEACALIIIVVIVSNEIGRKWPLFWWFWRILLMAGAGAGIVWALDGYPGDPLSISAFSFQELPNVRFYSKPILIENIIPDVGAGFIVSEPGFFPIYWWPLFAVAFWPRRKQGVWRLSLFPLLLLLPLLANYWMTMRINSGVIIAEKMRFMVMVAPCLVMIIGIGAWRLVDLVKKRMLLATVIGLIVFISFLAVLETHTAFTHDTHHNVQHETAFIRDLVPNLPDGALVLIPDFGYRIEQETADLSDISVAFRTSHPLLAYSAQGNKPLSVIGLRNSFSVPIAPWATLVVYLGVDCYRTPRPEGIHSDCAAVRHAGGKLILERNIPSSTYSSFAMNPLGPTPPSLDLGAYAFDRESYERLRCALVGCSKNSLEK